MRREEISHAINNIDTRHIQEAGGDSYHNLFIKNKVFYFKKIMIWVTSFLLFFILTVSTLAVADKQLVYDVVYAVSPRIAQGLRPVKLSSEDNGVVMEVVSAYIKDDEAHIYISMQDMIGGRIDETIDLFDSYSINRSFSSSATCRKISYDHESNTATFLISIKQWGGKEIGGEKITFRVNQFLSHKKLFHEKIPEIDLNKVNLSPKTQSDVIICGWGGNINKEYKVFLEPSSDKAFSPIDGVTVTGVGFIEDKLHIQVYYDNISETDNHGFVYLVDKAGEQITCELNVSFWDSEQRGSYSEYIFDISPNKIHNYEVYGNFRTSDILVNGNWQVTFPLEYVE